MHTYYVRHSICMHAAHAVDVCGGRTRVLQACRLIMVQLASAITHLHMAHSIAHRDIKLENVLCQAEDPTLLGSLKLAE